MPEEKLVFENIMMPGMKAKRTCFSGVHSRGRAFEELNGNFREVIGLILQDGYPA